jgi:hypothetical protein
MVGRLTKFIMMYSEIITLDKYIFFKFLPDGFRFSFPFNLQSFEGSIAEVLSNCAAQAHELNMDFDNCIVAFHRCKELVKKLKTATLHATSLALSKRSLEESDGDSFDPCNVKRTTRGTKIMVTKNKIRKRGEKQRWT